MTIETARRASLEFVCVFGQDAVFADEVVARLAGILFALESVCVFGHDGFLFIHPRALNLIHLRSVGTMPA